MTPQVFVAWASQNAPPTKAHSKAAFALEPLLANAKPRRQGWKVLVGSGKQARKEGDRKLPEPVTLT
jgi:hypothetical protein